MLIHTPVLCRSGGPVAPAHYGPPLVPNVQRIAEFYVDAATALIIKHDDGRRPVDGDFRNVPTVGEIIAQAQFASGRKGESGFAIRCPDDASPTAFCIRVVIVKSLRSQ
jgi:hypothetical protein